MMSGHAPSGIVDRLKARERRSHATMLRGCRHDPASFAIDDISGGRGRICKSVASYSECLCQQVAKRPMRRAWRSIAGMHGPAAAGRQRCGVDF
jgi:hypothetical protein